MFWKCATLVLAVVAAPFIALAGAPKPRMADPYLDLTVTYAMYAKERLWHDADVGGYWGEVGVGEKNTNGAVRGMANTMLGYAVLAHSWKQGWLNSDAQKSLATAELDQQDLLNYISKNLAHIAAHHVSANEPLQPVWGDHWQSPLWLSAAGFASFLVWDDLSAELKEDLKRMARHEADRVASIKPHDYKPGNTAAEENAWDLLSPALALALEPNHPNAPTWEKATRAYAVNTYSVPADRTSTAIVGTDPVREIVTTTNAFDDFTLDNHGFFHPDYVQVSGQHLGEAWALLALGDRIHGTKQAERYAPYGLHHVSDVWNNVTSKLLLPHGEFAFPSGNDWTYHCSMNQSYLAYIATALQNPLAQLAEQRAIRQAQLRRDVSPPGRILGDTNLEWWWEPLLIKRCSTALIHHILRDAPVVTSETEKLLDHGTWTKYLPDSHVWLHRNGNYFASVSWGKQRMGTFYPFAQDPLKHPYMTLPIDDGLVPNEAKTLSEMSDTAAVLELKDGRRSTLVCLPNSALWMAPAPARPIGIENHPLTGSGRTVYAGAHTTTVPVLQPRQPFTALGSALNIDGWFGHIASTKEFQYTPAGKLNRRSAAIDRLMPLGEVMIWQMIPKVTARETQSLSKEFQATHNQEQFAVTFKDGKSGEAYKVVLNIGKQPDERAPGKPGPPKPINSLTVETVAGGAQ